MQWLKVVILDFCLVFLLYNNEINRDEHMWEHSQTFLMLSTPKYMMNSCCRTTCVTYAENDIQVHLTEDFKPAWHITQQKRNHAFMLCFGTRIRVLKLDLVTVVWDTRSHLVVNCPHLKRLTVTPVGWRLHLFVSLPPLHSLSALESKRTD